MLPVAKEQLERVARIYKNNHDACRAVGMEPGSFARACRKFKIETPYTRNLKRWKKCRSRYKKGEP